MLQLRNVKKHQGVNNEKNEKPQRTAVQKENKASHSVQGYAVFPGGALCARVQSRLRCSFDVKALTSCEIVIVIPRRTSKTHHISSCT